MKRLTLFGLFLLLSTASIAADQIRLYKQYIVGTPKTHLQKIHKIRRLFNQVRAGYIVHAESLIVR